MYDLIYDLIMTSEVKSRCHFSKWSEMLSLFRKMIWFIDILLSCQRAYSVLYLQMLPLTIVWPRSGQLYRMVHILAGVASSTLVHIYSLILCTNLNTVFPYIIRPPILQWKSGDIKEGSWLLWDMLVVF